MGFVGEENRTRAQFSDLAIRDHRAAPAFEKLWSRAESTTSENGRDFSVPLVTFGLLVVIIAATAVAVWLRGATPTVSRVDARVETLSLAADVPPKERKVLVATSPVRSARVTKKRFAATRRDSRPIVIEALNQKVGALSNWQSPTNLLLESPVTPVFKSMPALNQSVRELESYLSSTELKESK